MDPTLFYNHIPTVLTKELEELYGLDWKYLLDNELLQYDENYKYGYLNEEEMNNLPDYLFGEYASNYCIKIGLEQFEKEKETQYKIALAKSKAKYIIKFFDKIINNNIGKGILLEKKKIYTTMINNIIMNNSMKGCYW
jgi:hypothetical protein